MATQLQVEAGYKLVLSTDEASTLQLWQVATINVDGNILGTVANNLSSWDNGILWHYNMPNHVMQVTETQNPWFRALVNSHIPEHQFYQQCPPKFNRGLNSS